METRQRRTSLEVVLGGGAKSGSAKPVVMAGPRGVDEAEEKAKSIKQSMSAPATASASAPMVEQFCVHLFLVAPRTRERFHGDGNTDLCLGDHNQSLIPI